MLSPSDKKLYARLAFVLAVSIVSACGGGGGGSSGTPSSTQSVTDCTNGGTGSVQLSWDAPQQDTEGAPINLAGFKVFCRTASGSFQWVASAAGSTNTTLVVDNLVSGTLTFAVTAVSVDGVESEYSAPTGTVIP